MELTDLRLSVIKQLDAKCLVNLYSYLKSKPTIIINGLKEARIIDYVSKWD